MRHCAEALKVRSELLKELAEVSAELGEALSFSAAETAALELVMAQLDRRSELYATWEATSDPKVQVKLSGEMRLLEGSVARLVRTIRTELPVPEARQTTKARKAARVRWDRAAG